MTRPCHRYDREGVGCHGLAAIAALVRSAGGVAANPCYPRCCRINKDAGLQGLVERVFDGCQLIQFCHQLELGFLRFVELRRPMGRVRHGSIRIGVDLHAVVLRPQIARLVRGVAAAEVARRPAQDDELRQLAVARAQAVVDPRSQGSKSLLAPWRFKPYMC